MPDPCGPGWPVGANRHPAGPHDAGRPVWSLAHPGESLAGPWRAASLGAGGPSPEGPWGAARRGAGGGDVGPRQRHFRIPPDPRQRRPPGFGIAGDKFPLCNAISGRGISGKWGVVVFDLACSPFVGPVIMGITDAVVQYPRFGGNGPRRRAGRGRRPAWAGPGGSMAHHQRFLPRRHPRATGHGSPGGAGGAPGPGRARAESPRRVDWRERGRRDDEERRSGGGTRPGRQNEREYHEHIH